jgi:hypothetical protein
MIAQCVLNEQETKAETLFRILPAQDRLSFICELVLHILESTVSFTQVGTTNVDSECSADDRLFIERHGKQSHGLSPRALKVRDQQDSFQQRQTYALKCLQVDLHRVYNYLHFH